MNRDNRVYGYNEYKKYYGRGNKIDNIRRDMDGTQYTSNRTMAIASSQSKASNEVNTYKYYTSIEVQKGDTLWTIAQQYAGDDADYASYIEEVKDMNQLTSDTIHAGEYLTVSYYIDFS